MTRHPTARTIRMALAAAAILAAFLPLTGCGRREEKVETKARCAMCGMDSSVSKGRFLVDFQDGASIDACSGHCAALFAAKQASPIYRIRVHAYDTDRLVDGRTAVYVLGAHRIPEKSMAPSVFAFTTREAAEALVVEHGGRIGTLTDVLTMAEEHP